MGERNSGTNFLFKTIEKNFDVEMVANQLDISEFQKFILTRAIMPRSLGWKLREVFLDSRHRNRLAGFGGWKHAGLTPEFLEKFASASHHRVICIVRHPVAWSRSLHKNPFHAKSPVPDKFVDFLDTPWRPRSRDQLGPDVLASPLVLWREKVRGYLTFAAAQKNINIVRYEDLVLNSEKACQNLSEILGPPKSAFSLPEGRIRAFVDGELSFSEYQEKARSTGFASLTADERRLFDLHIGEELFQEFSYF